MRIYSLLAHLTFWLFIPETFQIFNRYLVWFFIRAQKKLGQCKFFKRNWFLRGRNQCKFIESGRRCLEKKAEQQLQQGRTNENRREKVQNKVRLLIHLNTQICSMDVFCAILKKLSYSGFWRVFSWVSQEWIDVTQTWYYTNTSISSPDFVHRPEHIFCACNTWFQSHKH